MKLKGNKVFIFIIAVALMLALSLGACGGGGGGGGGSSDTGAASSGGSSSDSSGFTPKNENEILVGYVTAFTGPLSVFTEATYWIDEMCLDIINNEQGGIMVDGKQKKIRVIYGDSESDPTVASEVAQKLVLDDGIDILVGAWTPANSGPVSAVGERYGIPTYISNSPAESWIESGGPYYWAMGTLFYMEDLLTDVIGAFEKLDTNKTVGYLYDSEVDGVVISAMLRPMLESKGYTIVDPGRFPMDTADYTSIIKQLQAGDCDIVMANMIGPQFATAWKQFFENNYIPRAMNIGKAVHFQADADMLGEGRANGLITETLWDRSFPFYSPLIDMTPEQLATKWEDEFNSQYPATMGYDVSLWEVLSDSLARAGTTEPEALRTAILATNMDCIYGHLEFDENQVAKVPCITVQWHHGDRWSYEKTIVSAVTRPEIPTEQPFIIPNTTQVR